MRRLALRKFDPSPAAVRWLIALALGGAVSAFLLSQVPSSLLPSSYKFLLTICFVCFLGLILWLTRTPVVQIAFAPWQAIDERERGEQARVYLIAYEWLRRGLTGAAIAVTVLLEVLDLLDSTSLFGVGARGVLDTDGAKILLGAKVTLMVAACCALGLPMMVSTRLARPDDEVK